MSRDLAALGAKLREHGLVPRALAAWATARLSALPYLLVARPRPQGPAGALLDLFVAGGEVEVSRLRPLGDAALAALEREQLVELAGTTARARVALLPLAGALVACDRLDAPPTRELACWPDDSSYHLAHALPSGERASWIDLGCGSAFAPLARPSLARAIHATDLNPRAVELARLGAALSGVAHVHLYTGDLDAGLPAAARPADLVTCNAPIPDGDTTQPMWHATTSDFVARVYAAARTLVAPGGMVVVHAVESALAPVVADLPGERVIVTYTPADVRGFAVAWWRPDAPPRHVATRRELTSERPHVTSADRDV